MMRWLPRFTTVFSRARRAPGGDRRARRGLTLIDTLISVAILLVISTFTVQAMRNTVRLNNLLKQQDRTLRAPMALLRRELQLAFLTEDITAKETYETVFVGEDQDPDILWFNTRAHQRRYRDARESDQAEITLFAERMPRIDGIPDEGLILYQRESPRVDGEPGEGGDVTPIAYNVKEFNLRYLDGNVNEWKDEWDSRKAEFANRLPRAVELSMILYVPDPREPGRFLEKPSKTTVVLEFAKPMVQQGGGQGFGQ